MAIRGRSSVGLALTALFLAVVGCADVDADAVVIRGVPVTLTDQGGTCRLTYTDGSPVSIDLMLRWPCAIHRARDGSVRLHNEKAGAIFLVETSRPNPSRAGDCITEVQAVRVTGRTLRASEHHDSVAKCLPFQWDEVMFTGLFDRP